MANEYLMARVMVSDQIPAPGTCRCLRIFYVHDRLIYRMYLLFTAYRGSTHADDIFALYKNFTPRVRSATLTLRSRCIPSIECRVFEGRRILCGELFTVPLPKRFAGKRFNLNSPTVNRFAVFGRIDRASRLSRGI